MRIARRISPMPIVTGVVVLVFGGLTLLLNDELFIKLKPTIVNTIFASVLFAGVMTGRLYIKLLFDNAFHLPDGAWKTLTYRWIAFFVFLAILNEVIWRNFSTDFWVGFKLWGVVPISLIYGVGADAVHSQAPDQGRRRGCSGTRARCALPALSDRLKPYLFSGMSKMFFTVVTTTALSPL